MMQIPSLPNYVTVPQQPNYNAVKIDVYNPMVNVPSNQGPAPAQCQIPQYAQPMPMMPVYNYPQAQGQPYYMPPIITPAEVKPQPLPQVEQKPQPIPQAPVAQPVQAVEIPMQPQVVPPAPVIAEMPKADEKKQPAVAADVKSTPVQEKPIEIVQPQEIKPQVDLNAFLAKLTNPDFEIQASAMEEIANMIDKEPQKSIDLLDKKVIDALDTIIKKDTSALAGPTSEQEAVRQRLFNNEPVNDAEKALALMMTPKEQAERNKSYAIFTTAIMQKLYSEEYKKMNNVTVPITELPGAVNIVEQLKNNPNAMVRTSAIEALSYIQDPSYKKDLTTIFTIAQNDQDKGVQDAAKAALQKLNETFPEVAKAA